MTTRQIAFLGMVASAAALAVAQASQTFLHLVPCALCYLERWPYRAGVALGFLGLMLPLRWARLPAWLLVAACIAAAAVAMVHVGVEQHWWKSPLPECTAPDLTGLRGAARLARMPDRPVKSCEDVDYLVPAIPVTMAQANLAYALAMGAGLTMLLSRSGRRR